MLDAYLARIGVPHPQEASVSALRMLHAAHVSAIPFENLDIQFGAGIRLDLDHLYAKLVGSRRGGYCFEQNTLFLSVLQAIGFDVTPMEARVQIRAAGVRPRTHMVLTVKIGGDDWLADVGFGGEGLIEPVPIGSDATPEGLHRVVVDGRRRILQLRSEGQWIDLYVILPEPIYPVDCEVANWYTSTHPDSGFVTTLTAQRTTREVRYILRYPTYTEMRGDDVRTREIARHELIPLLRDVFLIDVPADARFSAIDSGGSG